MRLQFFAEDGSAGSEGAGDSQGGDQGDGDTDGDDNNGDQNQDGKSGEEKTFTQAELNKMMKAEKDSGKRSILKMLGVKDEKAAKEAMAEYNNYLESKKTKEEKDSEKLATLETQKSEAEKKAMFLENKFTAITEGVKLEAVEDVVALATLKVTDDKDFKTVIGEMKTKYPDFFTGTQGSSSLGTGSSVNASRSNNKEQGLGATLASSIKATQTTKSSYFSN